MLLKRFLPFLLSVAAGIGQPLLAREAHNGPVEFVPNKGQWQGDFAYRATSGNVDFFVRKTGFTYHIQSAANLPSVHAYQHREISDAPVMKGHVFMVDFQNTTGAVSYTEGKPRTHYYNYFLGNNAGNWVSEVHPCQAVDMHSLYPGIDLRLYGVEEGAFKYDLIVKAGADAGKIAMAYKGQDGLEVKDGKLYVHTSVGDVVEMKPYAYQYSNNGKKEIPCVYQLNGNTLRFKLGKYDTNAELVIDPTIVFATYSGSTADNWGMSATDDKQGNFYGAGVAVSSGYPVTPGAYQTTYKGPVNNGSASGWYDFETDIAISKFNANGTGLLYATYVGGTGNEMPHSTIVDKDSNLVVVGKTYSTNFPTQGAYDNTANGGADLVVFKLSKNGSQLLGSTYMGGVADDGVNGSAGWGASSATKHNYGDDARSEVITDNAGNIFVAANTKSNNFPVVNAYQSALAGQQDAVIFKLTPNLSNLLWSTYLGGTADDAAYVLALSANQRTLYVAGGTASTIAGTAGTLHPASMGGVDGFISKWNVGVTTPALDQYTYVGTTAYDQIYGIQLDDDSSNVYIMGQTLGTYPVTLGVYSNPGSSQFISKLDSNLTAYKYSTVYGSGTTSFTNISPVAFLVDECKNVYVSGWGGGANFSGNTNGMPISANAFQSTTDGRDFYFIVLGRDLQMLLYGSYFGGNNTGGSGEHVDGGTSRFDKNGVVYQAICAGCGSTNDMPTTPGVYSPTNQSTNCNLGALKISFDLGNVKASAYPIPKNTGCAPFTVQFGNNSSNATTYEWNFGDGPGTNTQTSPTHTYTQTGVYTVRLIASNTSSMCRARDTAYLTITVTSDTIMSRFTSEIIDSCTQFVVSVQNASVYLPGPIAQQRTKFTWHWGDGSTTTQVNPGTHQYAAAGSYDIMLVMQDSLACNSPDTFRKTITFVNNFVEAEFFAPKFICIPADIAFQNNSKLGTGYVWYFGDNSSSTDPIPTHRFDKPGTYVVMLVASNPNSCNGTDTAYITITAAPQPTANFDWAPQPKAKNQPVHFTNQSINATAYAWSFGDGNTSSEFSPTHIYRKTNVYEVCLVAMSAEGCRDTICKPVDVEIVPYVDITTGFTPNKDGNNDFVEVRGYGIDKVTLKIYNRWGQLVYEGHNEGKTWDGFFNDKLQEMDSYAYVLDVVFVDETKAHKQGNITLIQ